MVYFSINLAKKGPIREKTYPQKLVTKNRQKQYFPSGFIILAREPKCLFMLTTHQYFQCIYQLFPHQHDHKINTDFSCNSSLRVHKSTNHQKHQTGTYLLDAYSMHLK